LDRRNFKVPPRRTHSVAFKAHLARGRRPQHVVARRHGGRLAVPPLRNERGRGARLRR
jgi:hypothetical protein